MALKRNAVPRGFPNLARIRESIGLLVPKIKAGHLPPPKPPWQGYTSYDATQPIVSAQHLAIEVAKVYELTVGTLVVAFRSGLKSAAVVELGSSDDFFIEVDASFSDRPKDLGAILGHELAHIFLHRKQIRIANTWGNEILTDTTAALYGFAALMADTFTVTEQSRSVHGGVETTRRERKLGYLTPDELGYVVTRCSPDNIASYLDSAAAKSALRVGRRKALQDVRTPPLRSAPLGSRIMYRIRQARPGQLESGLPSAMRYGFGTETVSFRCPLCCQGMRLPTRKSLTTNCPRCQFELVCQT